MATETAASACSRHTCEGCEIQGRLLCVHTARDLLDFVVLFIGYAIPFLAGMIIGKFWAGLAMWLGLAVFFFGYVEAMVLCRHCPHYAEEGFLLRCHANWGLPKIPQGNPRPLNKVEKTVWLIYVAVLFLWYVPFFISSQQWLILGLTTWAAIVWGWTVQRTQCTRCYNLSCPVNRVPEEIRVAFFKNYPEFAKAWQKSNSRKENRMTEPIIQIEGLTRRFGKTVAVNGLDLNIERGEIFGLVGPDGAGKTTTIRMLAAILDPSAGSVRVMGLDTVKQDEAIKEKMGYMAQQFSLYGDLSVMENLNFYADIFGLNGPERPERIERLLRFARLTEFTERRAAHLSGGMQKKLALACALLHKPEVVLLDEPTTGVDPVSRREFWDILTELHLEGVTIFVSTPYMDEAERCSRVGLMHKGGLMVCDTPELIKGMVEGELIELRPGELHRARTLLTTLPGVIEVQTYGDLIHVFVEEAETGRAAITSTLKEAGIAISDLRQTQPRMEEAFISLVRRHGASDQDAEALLNVMNNK